MNWERLKIGQFDRQTFESYSYLVVHWFVCLLQAANGSMLIRDKSHYVSGVLFHKPLDRVSKMPRIVRSCDGLVREVFSRMIKLF